MAQLRVLIVEDDALLALTLADVLTDMGHAVCGSESTESGAVAAAAHHKPDLMIVDAGLRVGSGVAAVDQILLTGFVPHVFVSGDTLADQSLHPRAVVVSKPYLEPDLASAIETAFGAAALR